MEKINCFDLQPLLLKNVCPTLTSFIRFYLLVSRPSVRVNSDTVLWFFIRSSERERWGSRLTFERRVFYILFLYGKVSNVFLIQSTGVSFGFHSVIFWNFTTKFFPPKYMIKLKFGCIIIYRKFTLLPTSCSFFFITIANLVFPNKNNAF